MTPLFSSYMAYPSLDVLDRNTFYVSAVDLQQTPQPLIAKADALYSQNAIDELYRLLVNYKDSEDDEVLWRLARAACDKAKQTTDKEQKKALTYEAFEYVKRALQLNDNNFAGHKVRCCELCEMFQ